MRVRAVDHVGEPLGAVHPPLAGRTDLASKTCLRPRRRRLRRRAARPAAQGQRAAGARASWRRARRSSTCPATSGCVTRPPTSALRRAAPAPGAARGSTFVYGLPELNRERSSAARTSRRPAASQRRSSSALLPLARAGCSRRRRARRGHHRLVGQRRRAERGHAPPGARGEPEDATSRSSTSTRPRSLETLAAAGAQGVELRFVPVSAPLSRGIFATCFVELPAGDTPEAIAALYEETYAARAVRAPCATRLPEVAAVAGSNYAEVGFTLGPSSGGAPTRHAGVVSAHRQPDQGRRGPGDPEHEPDARPARDAVARGFRAVAVARRRRPADRAVIKLGGDVLDGDRRWRRSPPTRARAGDGRRLVVVHGGGPQATALAGGSGWSRAWSAGGASPTRPRST